MGKQVSRAKDKLKFTQRFGFECAYSDTCFWATLWWSLQQHWSSKRLLVRGKHWPTNISNTPWSYVTLLNRLITYLYGVEFMVQRSTSIEANKYQLIQILSFRSSIVHQLFTWSLWTSRSYGVSQGSVLGPCFFTLYTTPLSSLISSLLLNHHLSCISLPPSNLLVLLKSSLTHVCLILCLHYGVQLALMLISLMLPKLLTAKKYTEMYLPNVVFAAVPSSARQ